MINDATQIIAGVPGQNLDPLFLAKSQTMESAGFIMIAYDLLREETQGSVNSNFIGKRFYDLLFFKYSTVYECARLNQDLRFIISGDTALKTFETHRNNAPTLVYLFQAPEEAILRFRSTFYYEPCLKVQIGSLSKKQIITLLRTSRCRRGIVECNQFTGSTPEIHLTEIQSEEQLLAFNPILKHGRLLLYDIDKNREIIHERYARSSEETSIICNNRVQPTHDLTPSITPSFAPKAHPPLADRMGNNKALSKVEVDEFTQLIQQILHSPMSTHESDSLGEKKPQIEESRETCSGVVVRVQEENRPSSEPEKDTKPHTTNNKPAIGTSAKTNSPASKTKARKQTKVLEQQPKPSSHEMVPPPDKPQDQQSEYVRTFERLFRSFRQQVFEHFGNKCEEVISRAEKKVRFLSPDFDCHSLTEDNSPTILEVIEEIIKGASFMKRPKLRQAALTLVSDLYNKHNNLLEQHRALDKVEEFYYKLRR